MVNAVRRASLRVSPSNVAGLLLVLVAVGLAFSSGPNGLDTENYLPIWALLAVAYALPIALTRQFILNPIAMWGAGAYGFALVAARYPQAGPEVAALAGIAAGAVVGAVTGAIAFRVRGLSLAIVTLAVAFIWQLAMQSWTAVTGGADGMPVTAMQIIGINVGDERNRLVLGIAVAAIVTLVVAVAVVRRRYGRLWRSVGDSEELAAAVGVRVRWAKFSCLTVSGAICGLAGVLLDLHVGYINPGMFGLDPLIQLFAIVVIGGSSLIGGIYAAVLVTWAFKAVLSGLSLPTQDISYGLVLTAVVSAAALAPRLQRGRLASRTGKRLLAHAVRPPQLMRSSDPDAGAAEPHPPVTGQSVVRRDRVAPLPPLRLPVRLRASDVTVRFGSFTAVNRASITLEPRQVCALVGPNGAGKTTFLNALLGLVPVTEGEFELNGQAISSWSTRRRIAAGIGRTFQSHACFPSLSVGENIRLAYESGVTSREHIAVALPLLEEAGFSASLEDSSATLSTFDAVCLEIGRAIAAGARVLLCDEPSAGLGADERVRLARMLCDLRDNHGMALLVVEHDLSFVRTVADVVLVMAEGREIAQGTWSDVFRDTAVVQAYLGSAGQALIDAADASTVGRAGNDSRAQPHR